MNYRFIELLRNDYRVTELDHAFRINGVIDIYKKYTTLYDITKNYYHKDLSPVSLEKLANSLLLIYEPREDFKKAKHGITYQEFKNIKKEQSFQLDSIQAEDYHWQQRIADLSEDHLYFAIIDDKVKIGRSKNPKGRIKQLQTGLFKVPKVYVFNNKGLMETKMHHLFSDFRLEGEWFKFDIRLQHFLKKHHNSRIGYIFFHGKKQANGKKRTTTKHY